MPLSPSTITSRIGRRRGDEGDAAAPGLNLRPDPFGPAAGFSTSSACKENPDSPVARWRLLLVSRPVRPVILEFLQLEIRHLSYYHRLIFWRQRGER